MENGFILYVKNTKGEHFILNLKSHGWWLSKAVNKYTSKDFSPREAGFTNENGGKAWLDALVEKVKGKKQQYAYTAHQFKPE